MVKISVTQPVKRNAHNNESTQSKKKQIMQQQMKNVDANKPAVKKLKTIKNTKLEEDGDKDRISLTNKNEFNIDEKQFDDLLKQIKEKKRKQQNESNQQQKQTKVQQDPGRETFDDLPVYSAEELKIGMKGSGNTPQCPFDCDCCF